MRMTQFILSSTDLEALQNNYTNLSEALFACRLCTVLDDRKHSLCSLSNDCSFEISWFNSRISACTEQYQHAENLSYTMSAHTSTKLVRLLISRGLLLEQVTSAAGLY